MKKKIFLLIIVSFIFLNLFAVSAEDNETVIDDASAVNEIASHEVSSDASISDETINVTDSHNVGAIDPNLVHPQFVLKRFNTTDLVKIYKNDSQFIVDARNTSCNSKMVFIYHHGPENITSFLNRGNFVSFHKCNVNESGYATLNIDLNPGVYYISVEAFGSTYDVYQSDNKITVLPTIIGENLVKYYRNGSQFDIKLVDSKNNSVASEKVTFNINGCVYSRQTNENGIARLNINLEPGEYVLTAIDPLTGLEMSYNVTVLPTIIGENLVKYYRNGSQFDIKLVDFKNNSVASQSIIFNINGVFYSRQTNENGIARLNINLEPGEYVLTAIDPLTDLKMSFNVTVLPVLYANYVVSHVESCDYFVKLVDDIGNALSGKPITFNIEGLIINNVTDGSGVAKIHLNLMPGLYIITAQYLSAKISNSIIIT